MKLVETQRLELRSYLETSSCRPFFILGVGRSGTTALRASIEQHPNAVMVTGHTPMLHNIAALAYKFSSAHNALHYQTYTPVEPQVFRARLQSLMLDCAWGVRVRETKHTSGKTSQTLAELKVWGTRSFFDKQSVEGMKWLYPQSRYIYIIRNGIEVVQSMSKFKSFHKWSFERRCTFWAKRVFYHLYAEQRKDTLTIRFENLVNRPSRVMDDICKHLEVPLNPALAKFARNWHMHPLNSSTVQGKVKQILAERPPAYQDWTGKEKDSFKRICSDAMAHAKYDIPF